MSSDRACDKVLRTSSRKVVVPTGPASEFLEFLMHEVCWCSFWRAVAPKKNKKLVQKLKQISKLHSYVSFCGGVRPICSLPSSLLCSKTKNIITHTHPTHTHTLHQWAWSQFERENPRFTGKINEYTKALRGLHPPSTPHYCRTRKANTTEKSFFILARTMLPRNTTIIQNQCFSMLPNYCTPTFSQIWSEYYQGSFSSQ